MVHPSGDFYSFFVGSPLCRKCGSTEKYTKGKNKKAMEEPVDASEAVEAASGRTKREAEQGAPVDAKPRKGKKVPSETKTKGKKAKKSKKGAEKIDPESAVVEEEAVPSEAQDAKVSKKTKRSADDAGLADVPLSEKASKHKKKKATEAELNKKVKPKKAKKEPTAEEPKDIAVEDTEVAVEDAAGDANGPAGVKTEPETACASEQCANEE